MPIEKITGTTLKKTNLPYDIVPRETVDNLQSGEAMAIYLILLTRPNNWVIRKQWIMDRTGFGYTRYITGIKELESLGIIIKVKERAENGTILGTNILFTPYPNRSAENPHLGKNEENSDEPKCRFSEVRLNSVHKESRELLKKAESRKKFIPPSISDVREYISTRAVKIDPERFVDYYTANGWHQGKCKIKDWKACVRTWEKNKKTETRSPTINTSMPVAYI